MGRDFLTFGEKCFCFPLLPFPMSQWHKILALQIKVEWNIVILNMVENEER